MNLYPTDRVAIFIDGPSLLAASRALGFTVDYSKLLSEFSRDCVLIRAFYYTSLPEAEVYSPLRPLVDWLGYNGFTVVTKTAKDAPDSLSRKRIVGDMDIEVVCDMLEMSELSDHMILITGNSDFIPAIEALQRKSVRVTVVSTIKTSPPIGSDRLRRKADRFVDLADIMAVVAHHGPTNK